MSSPGSESMGSPEPIGSPISGQRGYPEWLRNRLYDLLQHRKVEAAKRLLEPNQPADITEAIEQLPGPMQVLAFVAVTLSLVVVVSRSRWDSSRVKAVKIRWLFQGF